MPLSLFWGSYVAMHLEPRYADSFIQLSDIDDYYATIQKAGAPIDVPLDDREYGMRDFHLIDPSGNQISFGQPIKIDA